MHPSAVLAQLEIVVSRTSGRPEAVFDLAAAQATAVEDALAYYRRVRFIEPAQDADTVGRMRAMDGLSDQAHRGGDSSRPAVFRLSATTARTVAEAAGLYVTDRDVESYQPPEERHRIALLSELSGPLRQVAVDLRSVEIRLADEARTAGARS